MQRGQEDFAGGFERGIDICHETVRMWWNRFGPLFAGDIRWQRVSRMRGFGQRGWHLDEMYVKLNSEMGPPVASGRPGSVKVMRSPLPDLVGA